MSEPQPAGSVNRAAPEARFKLERRDASRATRIRGARQRQQLQLVQTNPSGGGAQAPLPWQPSRAGDGKSAQPGELVGGSGAHRRESCARGPRAEAGHTAKPRPKGDGPRPLTAAVFWRQCVPPPANPKRLLPALSGLNCPPAGRRGMGGGLSMGEGGRARRARGERGKQPPTWLLPPRPPLLQYGLWRPRAAEPRRVSPGPPDTVSSIRAGRLSLLQPGADSRVPELGRRRWRQQWWWRPSAWGPRATYLSLGHDGDGSGT